MLLQRIIPVLLLKNRSLIKTVRFGKYQYIGDPCNTAKIFNELEVDEMIILDIEANQKKKIDFNILSDLASECFMPLSYGGGIRKINDAEELFKRGIEKIIINTHGFENNNFFNELSKEFGNQAIVASVDYKLKKGIRTIYSYSGRNEEKIKIKEWIKLIESSGVGELMLTFIDNEGTWNGFDYNFLKDIVDSIKIPVIAHGGAGHISDIKKAFEFSNVSAVGLGSLVVYQKKDMGVLVNFPNRELLTKKKI
ncbi:MAG: Imidazole glycerol phosphate synthase subunit HisF [Alphaproteobacteria bacterium MarineAlpha8_Bin1]|nr:MAG: Imidazole glycerol phosphate synthase subunit HisF [Alphaproteobacteria bacterium MarineAlpha8_Bin1]